MVAARNSQQFTHTTIILIHMAPSVGRGTVLAGQNSHFTYRGHQHRLYLVGGTVPPRSPRPEEWTMKTVTTITLTFTKATKNTIRYDAPSTSDFEAPVVQNLYVAKGAFKELGHFPAEITVTVTADPKGGKATV